jgi:hypothetical protein
MSHELVRHRCSVLLLAACCLLPYGGLRAQQAPPAAPPATQMPRPTELEPGVDTSTATLSREPAADVKPSAPAASSAATPAAARPAPGSAPAAASAKASAPAKKAGPDRLELEATDITGNRELPKVLYIVPWKHSDLGDLVGKPTNSLLDEVLQPIDRDVFQRENRYYDALKPTVPGAQAPGAPLSGDKP